MKLEKGQIVDISGDLTIEDKLPSQKTYDWLDIVGIPQRPINSSNSLYFATHSQGEGGWDAGFDRRLIANKVQKDKGWNLVVESSENLPSSEYLKVSSINQLSKRIYEEIRLETNPYIIGVTGSVGKTTTVAFLEHLISSAGIETKRFYSKRLTPLGVMCHYINLVEEDTPFVVMEYSAYLPDHVNQLSQIIPPNIAFLTNVYETHINPGTFANKNEILDSKLHIKPKQSLGFINSQVLIDLNETLPAEWNSFNIEIPNIKSSYLPPILRTAELYTVGKIISEQIGLSSTHLRKSFETFRPQEKRIIACNFQGKDIYFHGETSGGSRLYSWLETTDGSTPWMFIDEINFADEDPQGFINLLQKVLDSDKTIVLDTKQNRERLPIKAHFVDQEKFKNLINKATGYTIYHKALATRKEGFEVEKYLNDHWKE